MRRTNAKEIEGVLKLGGAGRFAHFVKRVADEELAWGLWNDGWALMADDDGVPAFPLWPAQEYARACATGDWADFVPRQIEIDSLLTELCPKLQASGVRAGIFPTNAGKGVALAPNELSAALARELENYGE